MNLILMMIMDMELIQIIETIFTGTEINNFVKTFSPKKRSNQPFFLF